MIFTFYQNSLKCNKNKNYRYLISMSKINNDYNHVVSYNLPHQPLVSYAH